MLLELHVRNLALIEKADVELIFNFAKTPFNSIPSSDRSKSADCLPVSNFTRSILS